MNRRHPARPWAAARLPNVLTGTALFNHLDALKFA